MYTIRVCFVLWIFCGLVHDGFFSVPGTSLIDCRWPTSMPAESTTTPAIWQMSVCARMLIRMCRVIRTAHSPCKILCGNYYCHMPNMLFFRIIRIGRGRNRRLWTGFFAFAESRHWLRRVHTLEDVHESQSPGAARRRRLNASRRTVGTNVAIKTPKE